MWSLTSLWFSRMGQSNIRPAYKEGHCVNMFAWVTFCTSHVTASCSLHLAQTGLSSACLPNAYVPFTREDRVLQGFASLADLSRSDSRGVVGDCEVLTECHCLQLTASEAFLNMLTACIRFALFWAQSAAIWVQVSKALRWSLYWNMWTPYASFCWFSWQSAWNASQEFQAAAVWPCLQRKIAASMEEACRCFFSWWNCED